VPTGYLTHYHPYLWLPQHSCSRVCHAGGGMGGVRLVLLALVRCADGQRSTGIDVRAVRHGPGPSTVKHGTNRLVPGTVRYLLGSYRTGSRARTYVQKHGPNRSRSCRVGPAACWVTTSCAPHWPNTPQNPEITKILKFIENSH
jgi:hypothetical protein